MAHLLGIDVGTTGTKAGLFDVRGQLVASASAEYPLHTPREGWVEQPADDWWDAVVATVRQVTQDVPRGEVSALSLSTQGGAWVPLDAHDRPMRNALSWMDKRAADLGRRLEAAKGPDWCYRLTGWPLGGGLPMLLTCWLRENEADLFATAAQFADTHAYVMLRLTGKSTTDHSNAAITQFYDLESAGWSDELCATAEVEPDMLPALARAGEVIGTLTSQAADELGLPASTPVVAGGHDQYCAALGSGVISEGTCLLSCGTAWVALVDSATLLFDPSRRVSPGTHVVPDHWGLLTSVPVAGAALKWFRDNFLPERTYESLSDEASSVPPGSRGLLFVPGNFREGTGSAFVGVDLSHGPADFVRALMEGVALAVRRNVEAIAKLGAATHNLTMIGGGARSRCWPQIVADTCNARVTLPDQPEAACAGAVMLAGIGSGAFPDAATAVASFVGTSQTREPTQPNVEAYGQQYARFCEFLA